MRIVAGTAGGRRIAVPAGRGTRPTSDRAREGLFSTVGALLDLAGVRVLDLYAGSGALGLEALSRGAGHATFVESDPKAARVIAANAEALGLAAAEVLVEPVDRFLRRPAPTASYELVFADPPYDLPESTLSGQLAALSDRIVPAGILVVERSARDPDWSWPSPYGALRVRRYGAGMLWYGRRP